MAILLKNLRIAADIKDQQQALESEAAQLLGVPPKAIDQLVICRRSLDSRQKRCIVYEYQIRVSLTDESAVRSTAMAPFESAADPIIEDPSAPFLGRRRSVRHPPVIVGSGPCGIFAALVLAKAGVPSIVLERGEPVERRCRTVSLLRDKGLFNPASNYCFGEGGAGTFSDGKLTCSRRHPLISYLLRTWVEFGAPPQILYEALPHIGSDNLVALAGTMRRFLQERGVRFLFDTTFVDFRKPGTTARYEIVTQTGETIPTDHVILAIGHAARDTFSMLREKGMTMNPKAFAIGTRVEHPQELIDEIQYGRSAPHLPPASYKLTAKTKGRGAWSFCMCPGGILLPTGSAADHLSVNGMSYFRRDSGFANAALVVNVKTTDFYRNDPLDGLLFQERLERAAYKMGGGGYTMPVQRLEDFIKERDSTGTVQTSYRPEVSLGRIDLLLPPFITASLREAMAEFSRKMPGFITAKAILAGVETKSSSPVTLCRTADYQSTSHPGIYPAGEGAGHAGGIVSAALDGVTTALAILSQLDHG